MKFEKQTMAYNQIIFLFNSENKQAEATNESDKPNDTNNNGKNHGEDAANHEQNETNKNKKDGDEVENASGDSSKLNKKDDNFNFEDFLKVENIADFLSVNIIT